MAKLKSDGELEQQEQRGSASLKGWVLLCGVFGVVLVLAALCNIWLYVQQVQNGYRLAKLQEESEKLIHVHRKLRLEWSRFQDPYHLEELGRKEFGLAPPKSGQKILMH
jgi:hypothetical protein